MDGACTASIDAGLMLLVGFEKGDDAVLAEEAARKVSALRIFEDDSGRMNHSIGQTGGAVLVVSQFTLVADLSRGRRPGFERALPPEQALALYEHFTRVLGLLGIPVSTGTFGAKMDVSLVNRGPATFVLDLPAPRSQARRGNGEPGATLP